MIFRKVQEYKIGAEWASARTPGRRYTSQTKNVYKLWRLHEKEKCVTFNFITYDNLWASHGTRLKNMLLVLPRYEML